jgi:hypothetical protein
MKSQEMLKNIGKVREFFLFASYFENLRKHVNDCLENLELYNGKTVFHIEECFRHSTVKKIVNGFGINEVVLRACVCDNDRYRENEPAVYNQSQHSASFRSPIL